MRTLIRSILPLLTLLLLGFANISQAATVSGSITNTTGKSGRLYVMLESSYGSTGIGTSYANITTGTAVPYTLHGVQPGNYTVRAFLDIRDNTAAAGYPYSESPIGAYMDGSFNPIFFTVTTAGDTISGKDFALFNMPTPSISAPTDFAAAPLDNGVLLFWEAPKVADYDIEIAHHYNLYWSTSEITDTSNLGAGGGSKLDIPSRDDGHAFIPLNDGIYYFAVEAVLGAATSTLTTTGPVTIGPATGGQTVTVAVNFLDSLGQPVSPDHPLLAILENDTEDVLVGSYIAAPAQNQTITISGVPNDSYELFLILDKNNNGLYDTGDVEYTWFDWKTPTVTVAGANVTMDGLDMLVSRNYQASLTTETWNDQWGTSYNLNFDFTGQEKRPAHFVVSGPQLATTDLTINSWGEFWSWHNLGNTAPTKGDSYSVTVYYTDSAVAPETFSLQVTNVLTISANPAYPIGAVQLGSNPRFGWNTLSGIPQTPFKYHIALNYASGSGDYLFETVLPPDQTSVAYTGPELVVNEISPVTYSWYLRMVDAQGNRSTRTASFTPQASGPAITEISPATLACGASDTITITGSGFNTTPASNSIYLNNTQFPITPISATGTSLTFQLPDCTTSYSPTGPVIVTDISNPLSPVSSASSDEFTPTFTYSGYVNDWDQNPLSGATIAIADSDPLVSTTSGADGFYQLAGIPTGKLYRQRLSYTGTSPVYTAYMSGYYDPPIPNPYAFLLPADTYLEDKGITAGKGIIRTRTRDNAGNNVGGVTITAYSSRYNSTSKYTVLYGDCDPDTLPENDSRFCIMNVEDGDMIRVTGSRSGYSINARVFQAEADAMEQGSLTATPIPATYPIASASAAMGASFDGTNYLIGVENHSTTPASIGAQLLNANGTKVGSLIPTGRYGISAIAAFDGTNHLLVWEDDPGGTDPGRFSMYGQFIDRAGAPVGSPFAISTSGIWFDGIKTMAFGGGKYLVTYSRLDNPALGDASTRHIVGTMVSPDGSMGSEFQISIGLGDASDVAFDGTNFFVVWTEDMNDQEIRGRFVSTSGVAGDEVSVNASTAPSDNPKLVAFDGTNYLVVWNDEVGGQDTGTWDVYGQLVSTGGSPVGSPFAITTEAGPQVVTSISFDGTNFLATWVDMTNDANHNGSCDTFEGSCWDVFGRYISTGGVLQGSKVIINATSGNQMGGAGFVNGKYLALVNNGVVMGENGFSQIGEVFAQFRQALTVPSAPTVTSINPASGTPGSTITITGSNFMNAATTVAFNGVAAAVSFVSTTQLNVTVPGGATTGTVTVTTAGGTASSASFTVTAPITLPSIDTFTPSGEIGDTITITGTNFVIGATTVSFNGAPSSSVTVASTTSLTAVVPAGATSGTISVTTASGSATSSTNFLVYYPLNVYVSGTNGQVIGYVQYAGDTASSYLGQCFYNSTQPCAWMVEARTALATVNLEAQTTDAAGYFSGWAGVDRTEAMNQQLAYVDMNEPDRSVTASFSLYPFKAELLSTTTYYATLAAALDAVATGTVIKVQKSFAPASTTYSRSGVTATLKGGWNDGFTSRLTTDFTSVSYPLTIGLGTLILDQIIVK